MSIVALFARISEAAELGKNEDVMTFVVKCENSEIHGNARIYLR